MRKPRRRHPAALPETAGRFPKAVDGPWVFVLSYSIIECIERVERYVSEGRETFPNDTKSQDAVLRNLHTLCESTQRLSAQLKAAHPETNWRAIAAVCRLLFIQ